MFPNCRDSRGTGVRTGRAVCLEPARGSLGGNEMTVGQKDLDLILKAARIGGRLRKVLLTLPSGLGFPSVFRYGSMAVA